MACPEPILCTDGSVALAFFTKKYAFSNFYELEIELEGRLWNCSEQYYQHSKALFFGDWRMASAILRAETGAEQKRLSQWICGFDQSIWDHVSFQVMLTILHAKFIQHPHLRRMLLETGEKRIVEASRDDRWGIGVRLHQRNKILDRANWQGQNKLGVALMMLRARLHFLEEELPSIG